MSIHGLGPLVLVPSVGDEHRDPTACGGRKLRLGRDNDLTSSRSAVTR